MARRLKLTPALQDRLCNMLMQGGYLNRAALACGIGESTLYRWLQLGEERVEGGKRIKPKRQFREFKEAVERVQAMIEQLHVQNIRQGAFEITKGPNGETIIITKDVRASMWFLERKFPDRYGSIERNEEVERQQAMKQASESKRGKLVVFGGRYQENGQLKPAPAVKALPPKEDPHGGQPAQSHQPEPARTGTDGAEAGPGPSKPAPPKLPDL